MNSVSIVGKAEVSFCSLELPSHSLRPKKKFLCFGQSDPTYGNQPTIDFFYENTIFVREIFIIEVSILNKRAQRALGRSPEEKVKGYSGAIYRGPLMLSTKYW